MRKLNICSMENFFAAGPMLWRSGLLLLLLGGLLPALAARAQQPVSTDSARPAPVPGGAPRRRAGFVIEFDNRQSFVQASAVRIIGLNAGILLPNRRWRIGLGGYTLRRNYADLYVYQVRNGKRTKKIIDTYTPELNLTYFTPNISYVFLQRRWLEISLPVGVGLGRSYYVETDGAGNTQNSTRGLFFPVEAGVNVLVKPFRWAGVSGSVGYRKSVFEVNYKEDFDGLYFSYRLNLFVGAIWRDWCAYRRQRHPASALPPAPERRE